MAVYTLPATQNNPIPPDPKLDMQPPIFSVLLDDAARYSYSGGANVTVYIAIIQRSLHALR